MISARSESPSSSTSKRSLSSSTPAGAISSRTRMRTFVRGEGRGDGDAAFDLDACGRQAVLDGGESGRDVEEVEVADVADPEDLSFPGALAADQLDAEPVAEIQQERGHVELLRRADGRDDRGAILVGRRE